MFSAFCWIVFVSCFGSFEESCMVAKQQKTVFSSCLNPRLSSCIFFLC
jgi:hypothetical protein